MGLFFTVVDPRKITTFVLYACGKNGGVSEGDLCSGLSNLYGPVATIGEEPHVQCQ